jgi:hypothetical protein
MPGHSLFIMVPTTGQGAFTDPVYLVPVLQATMKPPFDFSDVFIYSHGWWTDANRAMDEYTRFSVGLAGVILLAPRPPAASLGIGIHWPSMLSEDSRSPLDFFEALSYFNRAMMADDVGEEGGYAMLRVILEVCRQSRRPAPRIHFLGHSFGCKVVCSILQTMATSDFADYLEDVRINLVLLEAAFEYDGLDPGQIYGKVIDKVPNLRILVTKSQQDSALTKLFVNAGRLKAFGRAKRALGDVGPSDGLIARLGAPTAISVDVGYTTSAGLDARLVVADLTPLHQHDTYPVPDAFSGHHSDIFQPEVYQLIAGFLLAGSAGR